MSESELRVQLLQQIPVVALRELVAMHLDEVIAGPLIRDRFYSVLHRKPRNFQKTLQRLTREQLTLLITASPEISYDEIHQQYEEHRYGISPSFYIYLFDPARLNSEVLRDFHKNLEQALKEFNSLQEEGLPNVRRVVVDAPVQVVNRAEILEASYRFQSRLDFIDENENAVSPYETLYGFFWLNTADGYVILQARHLDVLKAMKRAIEAAACIHLAALVITKRFKNALQFLPMEQICSVKLHDPMPDSPSFRWLTISDDNLYKKNYLSWENNYPEVRSARYRTYVEGYKETTITVRCNEGALSLAGAVPASLFRSWCLNSLGELVKIHHTYRAEAEAFVPTLGLASTAEMARFTGIQKDRVIELITTLLALKSGAGADLEPLNCSPLELAATLGSYVTVQVSLQCQEPGCEYYNEELLVACENCGSQGFSLQHMGDAWELICRKPQTRRWSGQLPLKLVCPNGHSIVLDEEMLGNTINVIPTGDLLVVIRDVINSYLPDVYRFDPSKETFFIRGSNLWYFPDRGKAWARILIIQNIGTVEAGAEVAAIKTSSALPA